MKEKKNKVLSITLTVLQILSFLAFLYLAYSIYLINGVENELRYIGIAVLFLLNLGVIILRKITKNRKVILVILYILLCLIFILGQSILGYYIHKTYQTINSINKDTVTYASSLVVLKSSNVKAVDALKNKKIGIVVNKKSIDEYILANQIVKNDKLDEIATIVEYDNITTMFKDLYKESIDAVLTTKNYVSMFKSLEGYEKIQEETKIIDEIEKTYKKNEISKITGESETVYNSNASITEPFTVLLMGVDSTDEALDKNSTGNGDALMLITFNPKTLNATILSIPRDSYVYLPNMGTENKITHAAWGGTSNMINTIERFTDIDINYYVKINFKGVVKLVDLLGGIKVNVPIDFCEQDSNRNWGDSTICLDEGEQTLNGEQALALARHRKTLLTGDLQRGTNQQLVVQGMLNSAKNIKSANQALSILDTLSNNMDTNFTTKQLLSFYDIFKVILETSSNKDNLINIQKLYLSGVTQGIYDERTDLVLSDYILNQSSLDQCIKAMKDNLSKDSETFIKEFDFDIKDPYETTTIGTSNLSSTKTYSLLPSFIGDSLESAKSWLESNNITVTVVEKEDNGPSGIVLEQSFPEDKRLDLMDGKITLTVSKAKTETGTPVINPVPPTDPETPGGNDTDNPTTPDKPDPNPKPTEPEPEPTKPTTPDTPTEGEGN